MEKPLEYIDLVFDVPHYIRLAMSDKTYYELGYYATLVKYNQMLVAIGGIEPMRF